MDERARRIVEKAIELAERDGFAAVRLRDVAARAGVALGTVYKRFSSKEEILVAALQVEAERLMKRLARRPPTGDTAFERVSSLFETLTRTLVRRPKLSRALIRSLATGGPQLHGKVASFHGLVAMLIVAALRGQALDSNATWGGDADAEYRPYAVVLQHVWFASMVGWASGIHDDREMVRQVQLAARLLLEPGRRPQ